MNTALFSGLSATRAEQTCIDVASNNLANVNTTGYKAQQVTFEDAFYQTLQSGTGASGATGGTEPMQVGTGVTVASAAPVMTQGSIENTGQPLDAALDGTGLFVVQGPAGVAYTRNGSFQLDDSNTLVTTAGGLKVQGWEAVGGAVSTAGAPTNLVFPVDSTRSPKATANVQLAGNLPSGTAKGDTATASATVYDSLGVAHSLALTFTKTADNTWSVVSTCEGTSSTATAPLLFGSDGTVTSGGSTTLTATMPGGAAALALSIDFGAATEFASGNALTVTKQDGYASASLQDISITAGGLIEGSYTDGGTMTLGQLAVASFANEGGLDRNGSSLYTASASAGLVTVGAANEDGRGNVVSQSLEMSNTDLTGSLLNLLIAERAYQAGARAITTADTLVQEAIQLIHT